jgi:FAD:protein FMN transferase
VIAGLDCFRERLRPGIAAAPAGHTITVDGGEAAATDGPIVPVSVEGRSMGGRLVVHLDAAGGAARPSGPAEVGRRVIARVDRWASRLTRHDPRSELERLNADLRREVPVGPTLAAALRAGLMAAESSEGLVDISMLEARLAAEAGVVLDRPWRGPWSVAPVRRGLTTVTRPVWLRFDLGGVGKGWLADRAIGLLRDWPGAVVDADGDLSITCAPGRRWDVAIGDPRDDDANLAILRLAAPAGGSPLRWGVATSGISIHHWTSDGRIRHHLIDPRTGEPARTDVVQATVVAGTALRAEALAKAAVIAGVTEGFALLERARVLGAVILTESGDTLALAATLRLLASQKE